MRKLYLEKYSDYILTLFFWNVYDESTKIKINIIGILLEP